MAIAAGTERLSSGDGLLGPWHHLLLGRVVAVSTDHDRTSPASVGPSKTLEVRAALGPGEVPPRTVVASPDAGGNGGYPFTLVDAFAIPVRSAQRLGHWSSSTCDPITPLVDLDAAATHLVSIANAHGLTAVSQALELVPGIAWWWKNAVVEQRLSLVTLGVTDLHRARTFYESIGWQAAAGAEDDVVFFQAGGMIVALWGRDKLAEDSGTSDGGGWGGVTLAYNARSPAEVDTVVAEARGAGATIAREPGPTFWGGYSGVFVDPEGHPWEVAHNPGWHLDDDGSVRLRA